MREKDNYLDLVNRVDPVKVLEALEFREPYDFRISNDGYHLRGRCPVHQSNDWNFGMDLSRGYATCYSHKCFHEHGRNIGGVLYAIIRSRKKVIEFLEDIIANNPIKVYNSNYIYVPPTLEQLDIFKSRQSPYLEDRGICKEVQKIFEVGFGDDENHIPRVTLPVRMPNGDLLGILGRRTDGDPHLRYFVMTDYFPTARSLYGMYQSLQKSNTGKWILVEGPLDVQKSWHLGVTNVVGTMGSSLSWQQAALLTKHGEEVWVVRENDEPDANGNTAGDNFVRSAYRKLHKSAIVYVVDLPKHVKDVGALDDIDEWQDALDNRRLLRV